MSQILIENGGNVIKVRWNEQHGEKKKVKGESINGDTGGSCFRTEIRTAGGKEESSDRWLCQTSVHLNGK